MQWIGRLVGVLSLVLLVTVCSKRDVRPPEKPISSVDFGAFRLRDDLRKTASHVLVLKDTVLFTFCDQHREACPPAYGITNDNGVSVILWTPFSNSTLFPITERPRGRKAAKNIPLASVPDSLVALCCETGTNWYPMSRLAKTTGRYFTTSERWPILTCDLAYGSCVMGFAVHDAFAEAGFGLNRTSSLHGFDLPSQSAVWALATAVDAQIRAVSIPSRPQP